VGRVAVEARRAADRTVGDRQGPAPARIAGVERFAAERRRVGPFLPRHHRTEEQQAHREQGNAHGAEDTLAYALRRSPSSPAPASLCG